MELLKVELLGQNPTDKIENNKIKKIERNIINMEK